MMMVMMMGGSFCQVTWLCAPLPEQHKHVLVARHIRGRQSQHHSRGAGSDVEAEVAVGTRGHLRGLGRVLQQQHGHRRSALTQSHTQSVTHTHSHSYIQSHIHAYTHTVTDTDTHITHRHKHTQSVTHITSHTDTHTVNHTHTHTYTQSNP